MSNADSDRVACAGGCGVSRRRLSVDDILDQVSSAWYCLQCHDDAVAVRRADRDYAAGRTVPWKGPNRKRLR